MPVSSARRRCQRLRQRDSEDVAQQLVDVLTPADCHGRGGHAVFEQQARRHAHRDRFTESGVAYEYVEPETGTAEAISA